MFRGNIILVRVLPWDILTRAFNIGCFKNFSLIASASSARGQTRAAQSIDPAHALPKWISGQTKSDEILVFTCLAVKGIQEISPPNTILLIFWSDQCYISPMDAKMTAPRLADVVAREIEQRVLAGRLKPGDRLPSERDLSAQLGVSRASLREAIHKLAARGLLESRQGGGTFVTNRLDSGFGNPWEEILRDHPAVHEDMLEFRYMLEGRAAECAAQRATVADRERVRQCLAQLEEAFAGDDLDRQVDTDLAFHQAIAEASHNVIVGHLTASLLRLMRDNLRRNLSELMQVPAAREQLLDQHRAVWHAIEQGKAGQALEAAADHIGYVRQNLARMLRSDARLKP
ncbi:MAG: GntR family transcriptional regulator [Sulfuritalea sp.]|nr:GntR family transcriptional regulator [Sulfuritalea sp.]